MSHMDEVRDPQTGISIRFIRDYDATKDTTPTSLTPATNLEMALWLVSNDERDIQIQKKMRDACAFIKGRIH